jgi:hypothetical protein
MPYFTPARLAEVDISISTQQIGGRQGVEDGAEGRIDSASSMTSFRIDFGLIVHGIVTWNETGVGVRPFFSLYVRKEVLSILKRK